MNQNHINTHVLCHGLLLLNKRAISFLKKQERKKLQQQNRRVAMKKEITNISFVLIFISWYWVPNLYNTNTHSIIIPFYYIFIER